MVAERRHQAAGVGSARGWSRGPRVHHVSSGRPGGGLLHSQLQSSKLQNRFRVIGDVEERGTTCSAAFVFACGLKTSFHMLS